MLKLTILLALMLGQGHPFLVSAVIKGTLYGSVRGVEESVIPFAKFTLEDSNNRRVRVAADENGNYVVSLEPGIYHFVEERISRFRPFRRARFIVKPGEKTLLNILPVPPPPIIDTVCPSGTDCEAPYLDHPPRYDVFQSKKNSQLDVVIRFSEKRSATNGVFEYSGVFTMASVDALSLYASSVSFNAESNQIVAENGIIEDGNTRRGFRWIKVDVVARTFVINTDGRLLTEKF